MQKETKTKNEVIEVVNKGVDEKNIDSFGCCAAGIFPLR